MPIVSYGGGWDIKEEEKVIPPKSCSLCGEEIIEFYYIGYNGNKIYAEICDRITCVSWLKYKVKRSV